MKGFVVNLEKDTLENNNFRKILYTAKNIQLVLMSIESGDDIGNEVHKLDQFLRVEKGIGKAVLNDIEYRLEDGFSVVVPAGVKHNIINIGDEPLKLYSLYSPPEHKDGTIQKTKKDALVGGEHFDGNTTE